MPENTLFRDLILALLAAAGGGALAYLLRLPLFLGYIVGGALVGPFVAAPGTNEFYIMEQLAELGVLLLMFTLGLQFSLKELMRMRRIALGGGLLGILATIGLFAVLSGRIGLPFPEALALGAAVSVSSTMIIAKLLMERGELDTVHGRLSIGTLLVEDLAVVVMLFLLPALAALLTPRAEGMSPGNMLDMVWALGKGLAVVLPVFWLAMRAVPPLLDRVARARNFELFLLATLVLSLGTGLATAQVGLSPALGAFLAGLIIGESDYVHETLARVLPLRDLFVALFFVSMGMLIDPDLLAGNLLLVALLVGAAVVGKGLIRGFLVRLFRYPFKVALFTALAFTQIGEFSFILGKMSAKLGLISPTGYNALLVASLLSIFLSSFLFRLAPNLWASLARRFPGLEAERRRGAIEAPEGVPERGHVILCGYGRMGSAVGEALERFGPRFVVIERNPEKARRLKAHGTAVIVGDAAHEPVIQAARPERALLAVLALPDFLRARGAFRHLRAINPALPVLARAHWDEEREELFREGVSEVIQPEFEGAIELIRHALLHVGVPAMEMEEYLHELRQQRYGALLQEWLQREDPHGRLQKAQEVEILKGSPLAGRSLRDCQIRERTGATVLQMRKRNGRTILNPPPETVLEAGDRVLVLGTPTQIVEFMETNRSYD
jgi:CPA2 family monovalent cation:H+ antiporter-2